MDLLHLSQILEQLQEELSSLQTQIRTQEATPASQARRISIEDAENRLGVSRFHMHRLIGAGVIQSSQRIGTGKNATWTFDYHEIEHLIENPSYLQIEPIL